MQRKTRKSRFSSVRKTLGLTPGKESTEKDLSDEAALQSAATAAESLDLLKRTMLEARVEPTTQHKDTNPVAESPADPRIAALFTTPALAAVSSRDTMGKGESKTVDLDSSAEANPNEEPNTLDRAFIKREDSATVPGR